MTRFFKGKISTDKVSSECEFEFEVDDNATDEEIEAEAKDAAFNYVSWNYEEIRQGGAE